MQLARAANSYFSLGTNGRVETHSALKPELVKCVSSWIMTDRATRNRTEVKMDAAPGAVVSMSCVSSSLYAWERVKVPSGCQASVTQNTEPEFRDH